MFFSILMWVAFSESSSPRNINVPPHFSIVYLSLEESPPVNAPVMTLFPEGDLGEPGGSIIEDSDIKTLLHDDPHATSKATHQHVAIMFEDPKKTSIGTLKHTLLRFKAGADPNIRTTIYVLGVSP